MSSLRKTTLPGVAAKLAPRLKLLVPTWRGRPPLWAQSSTKLRMPATMLPPAVSKARFKAAGLVGTKFVGETAAVRIWRYSSAFASAFAAWPGTCTRS
jgi:hypothetical protein